MFEREIKYGNFPVTPEDLEVVDEMFKITERNLVLPNPTMDPVEFSIMRKIHEELMLSNIGQHGFLRPHVDMAISSRRERGSYFPAAYALRVLEFAVDQQLRTRLPQIYPVSEPVYPKYFGDPEIWNHFDTFGAVIDMNDLYQDMVMHDLQTSRKGAYAIYHLLTQLLGEGLVGIDNGISLGLAPKHWLGEGERPMQLRAVTNPRRGPIIPGEMDIDAAVQHKIDNMMANAPVVDRLVGYDKQPINPHDEAGIERVFSHTLPFSESIRHPDEVDEFYRLAHTDVERVKFVRDHVIATKAEYLEVVRAREYLPDGKADFGILSAFLFENSPEDVARILCNQAELYKPGGKMFVADFAKANPNAPFGIDFIRSDWWTRPGSFTVFMLDPHQLEKPAVKVGSFTTRYGDEIMLSGAGRRMVLSGSLDVE